MFILKRNAPTQNARTHTKCYVAASPHWRLTF